MLTLRKYPLNDRIGSIALTDYMGSDLKIVNMARASVSGWSDDLEERDESLIYRLMKDKHTSPFEHVVLTFHVKAPIFVARQWMRHRTQSFSELSRRYTSKDIEFYLPKEWRTQHKSNKQMSGDDTVSDNEMYWNWLENHSQVSVELYEDMIEGGVAREMARMVLPVNLYTEFYATANLLNWFRFCGLRSAPDAQHEIRWYSEAIEGFIKEVTPVTYSAWKQFGL